MNIQLPEPQRHGNTSLEESLLRRQSVRTYSNEPLTIPEISQLLWAAQGITRKWGGRTAPSAGGLYPLELYLVASNVENLTDGLYHYDNRAHSLERVVEGDLGPDLAKAAMGQKCVRQAAANLVFTAVFERTTGKYGQRAYPYVYMEVGHAAQNVCLQATTLGLGTVTIGAFHDEAVSRLINLEDGEIPLYILSLGRP